jgi:hypothetical protein
MSPQKLGEVQVLGVNGASGTDGLLASATTWMTVRMIVMKNGATLRFM